MKRLFLLFAILSISSLVMAQKQDTSAVNKESHKKHEHDENDAYITFQAGQAMLVKDSKAVKLEKDVLLKDGTLVMTDGKIKKGDGNVLQMKVGDRIYIDEGLRL